MMKLPQEIIQEIAARAKARRLALDLTQEGLASRSGVPLSTLKQFEHTGKTSLESLLALSLALGTTHEFDGLFATAQSSAGASLDDLMKTPKQRKRGSVK
jgi:transcriptional regulator with XRE-family HTH domain